MTKRYVRVVTSTPYDEITEYQELDVGGVDDEKSVESIARDMFHNNCNYGHSVVDESEVPKEER